jgi:hypothetical protein
MNKECCVQGFAENVGGALKERMGSGCASMVLGKVCDECRANDGSGEVVNS